MRWGAFFFTLSQPSGRGPEPVAGWIHAVGARARDPGVRALTPPRPPGYFRGEAGGRESPVTHVVTPRATVWGMSEFFERELTRRELKTVRESLSVEYLPMVVRHALSAHGIETNHVSVARQMVAWDAQIAANRKRAARSLPAMRKPKGDEQCGSSQSAMSFGPRSDWKQI